MSLPEAGKHVEASRLPRNFLRNRKQGLEKYRSEVTAFELKNLLPVR